MRNMIVTGIDIGQTHVLSVTLQESKNNYRILRIKDFESSQHILAETHLIDHQSLVNTFTKIRKNLPFWQNRIAMLLPDTAVMARFVSFDELDNHLSLPLSLQQVFHDSPIPLSSLYMDHTPTEEGYLVHLVKRDVISNRLELMKSARLKLTLIDTEKQALGEYLQYVQRCHNAEGQMLIDISMNHIRMVFKLSDQLFYRHTVCAVDASDNEKVAHILTEVQRFQSFYSYASIQSFWIPQNESVTDTFIEILKHQLSDSVTLFDPWTTFNNSDIRSSCSFSPVLAIGAALRGIAARQRGYDAL